MKRTLFAAGILVLGLLVFFWIRSPSDTEKSGSDNVEDRARGADLPPSPKRMQGERSPRRLSGGPDTSVPTRTYVRDDGTIVRDHRSNPTERVERRPTLPKELSKVKPNTLRLVRLALRPAMKKCIAMNAGEAAEKSRAQAVLTVSIKDEVLRVDQLDFQSAGLSADNEASLRECATNAVVGHTQPIADSPDVDEHVMTFPYKL